MMSKLQNLIQELCPDGVEYKKLEEVCIFQRGNTITAKNAIAGNIPVIAGGQKPAYYHNIANRTGKTIVVAGSGAYAGYVTYWEIPVFVSDAFSVDPTDCLDIKYLYYFLKNIQDKIYSTKKGSGVPHVHGSSIAKFEIPVPPLEVQEEIVKILDRFAEYAAELQAELQARKEQYEYYRNKLLMFDKIGGGTQNVTWMKMSEICLKVSSGGTPNTSKQEYYNGSIPWLRTQEVDWNDIFDTEIKISEKGLENSSAKMIPINCVIIAMYGATAAKVAVNKIPLCTNQACCNLEINPLMANYRFVYQWLCKEYENLRAKGEGSQNNINGKKIKNLLIPIPPLTEQERIISILDRFETLVNDLTQGLPAEITAVQEQYEYYRNKLLSFPRLKISA